MKNHSRNICCFVQETVFREVARALRHMLAKKCLVWMAGDQAMIYKSHHIHVTLDLNPEMDCWVANADVSWEQGDAEFHQLLKSPVGYFKVIDEAEIYAVEMAKTWIDAESTED